MTGERLLTAREVADLLAVTASTIVDWAEAGRLPFIRLGGTARGRLRFRESDILAVIASWTVPARSERLEVV